jgi:hypothetical protein
MTREEFIEFCIERGSTEGEAELMAKVNYDMTEREVIDWVMGQPIEGYSKETDGDYITLTKTGDQFSDGRVKKVMGSRNEVVELYPKEPPVAFFGADDVELDLALDMFDGMFGPERRSIKQRLVDRFKWAPHNIIAHPVSEILWQLGFIKAGDWVHDVTVPKHVEGTGRG